MVFGWGKRTSMPSCGFGITFFFPFDYWAVYSTTFCSVFFILPLVQLVGNVLFVVATIFVEWRFDLILFKPLFFLYDLHSHWCTWVFLYLLSGDLRRSRYVLHRMLPHSHGIHHLLAPLALQPQVVAPLIIPVHTGFLIGHNLHHTFHLPKLLALFLLWRTKGTA